ncbi:tudor domain-containing protein 3-like isoform X2 [Stylophora pistillata]|uniref:tudor domain-containing protein 3-like isoform X2 n=1 Tax=Stylophora pistillata TaxID=50429 RepID=UPI000C051C96|nr:tudor domain-containing protein 3-like isoform X2 [Stylophora pistillata]
MEAKLKEYGWFLSSEGIAECERVCNKEKPSFQELLKAARNLDLKQYGVKHLPDDINRGKVQSVNGPMVLQVQKLRNVSAPKSNEESNHSPRFLKVQLTDGHLTCYGLEIASIPDFSLSVPPGTKVCLSGTITVQESFLMLNANNTRVLGGEVEKLKEKWELNKTLAKHSRMTVSGDGPPPFVPFDQGTQPGSENRGRSAENTKVNGVVQNSNEKSRSSQIKDGSGLPPRSKTSEPGQHNKPVNQEQREGSAKNFAHNSRDDRAENKRPNTEKTNEKYASEGKTNSSNPKDRDMRSHNSEPHNNERAREGNQGSDDRQNNRMDRSERMERAVARGQPLRPQDTNRGGTRPRGRGGKREPAGRGRQEGESTDDVEDYRVRQPSEPELWDFLSTKLPNVKDSTNPRLQKYNENKKTNEVHQESPPPRPPPQQENDTEKPKQQKQDSRAEKVENVPPASKEQTDVQRDHTTPREIEKSKQESSPQSRDGRQQSRQQREPYYKQQQNPGQAKGKGSRRHDHDSRPYNQSLPPRLQRKQQQQQQQRQQQQQHHHHHHQHYQQHGHKQETDVNSDGIEVEYAAAGSPPSVAQEDDAIVRFSAATVNPEFVEDSPSHHQQTVQFRDQQGGSYTSQPYAAQGKWQKNYRQGSEQLRPPNFTPPNVQQQQQQHIEFVTMAMESQRAQAQFVVNQPQQFVEQGGREQAEIGVPQEYQYTQQAQPPVQAYPVYQLRPPQMTHQAMAPQPAMPQQPVATQMPAQQVGWKKGDHCLAPWRDGQYYSAKMEELMGDGVNCVVSFLDFHNSCDVVPLSSLRPFPIIAWGESSNTQPPPASAVATVPYYTQGAPVGIVTRPQVMIPVTGQPPFHAGTRPTIVHSTPVPAQVQWQPAQVQYQDIRQAAFQPIVHYGAVPQSTTGAPAQAGYGVATATGVHFVRGVKDTQGQDVYNSIPEAGRGRSSPNSSGYSKPRRPNRATQNYYIPPRQQKFKDKG